MLNATPRAVDAMLAVPGQRWLCPLQMSSILFASCCLQRSCEMWMLRRSDLLLPPPLLALLPAMALHPACHELSPFHLPVTQDPLAAPNQRTTARCAVCWAQTTPALKVSGHCATVAACIVRCGGCLRGLCLRVRARKLAKLVLWQAGASVSALLQKRLPVHQHRSAFAVSEFATLQGWWQTQAASGRQADQADTGCFSLRACCCRRDSVCRGAGSALAR